VLVEITGADIENALENGLSLFDQRAGRFPQVSGLRYTFDPNAPVGRRIVSVSVGDAPLDRARRYSVASNNFMLGGGDGYSALSQGKVIIGSTDGKLMTNAVMAHLRELGTVKTGTDGRIVMR